MKQLLLGALALFMVPALFAQKKEHHCAKRDAFDHIQMKSNNLSVAEIAQTEKYDVKYYGLNLSMDNQSTDVSGVGLMLIEARENMDSILIELFNTFTISEVRVNGQLQTFSHQDHKVGVQYMATAGEQMNVSIMYSGTPPNGATNPLGGGGMTNDVSPSWGNRVTWSLSEPFSAYEWFPCKQSLRDKADSCDVFLTVPDNLKAGSNGILENVVDLGNGFKRFEWKHRHPIVYYLISVAVAEYEEYNVYAPISNGDSVFIQNFIYNNPQTLPAFQQDIEETADFMTLYDSLFGHYPFADEKYGHCMAPLGGGMEHQTMTTQGYFIDWLTAHELGHQWWGDNVTCASWADIWVNEGFASYSEQLMYEFLKTPIQARNNMLNVHSNVMNQPGGSVWVEDSLNTGRIFSGRLTYDKGAAIVHTMRFIMNDDELFFQTLRDFQNEFADSVAIGLDLQDAFTAASGIDYTSVFNEWYFGEGYPTYTVRNARDEYGQLHIRVTHTTSSSTPTFTNPIELSINRSGLLDTIIRLEITSNDEYFKIDDIDLVESVDAIDPNNWIIDGNSQVVRDQSMIAGLSENEINAPRIVNPMNDQLEIFTDLPELEIRLVDLRGRSLIQTSISQNQSVDVSELKSGRYLVFMTSADGKTWVRQVEK